MTSRPTAAYLLLSIFVAPGDAFVDLQAAPGRAWPALALILAGTSAAALYFFSGMSAEWLVEQHLRSAELQPSQVEAARAALMDFAPYAGVLEAFNKGLAIVATIGLLGLWYWLAARWLRRSSIGFVVWCAAATLMLMPLLLQAAGVVFTTLSAGGGNLPLEWLAFGRFDLLLPSVELAHPALAWIGRLNLFAFWSFLLGACCYRMWTSASWRPALLISLPPHACIALLGGNP